MLLCTHQNFWSKSHFLFFFVISGIRIFLTSLVPSSYWEFSMRTLKLNVKRAPEMSSIFGSQWLQKTWNKKFHYLDNRAQLKSVTSGKHLFNDILCWFVMRFIKAFVAPLVHFGRFKSGHGFLLEFWLHMTTPVRTKRIIFDCPFIVK